MITLNIDEKELTNVEAEKALLSVLLASPERFREIENLVDREDFTEERNEEAFFVIKECYAAKVNPLDNGKLKKRLENVLNSFTSEYVDELLNGPYVASSARIYAKIVAEKAWLRAFCIRKGVKVTT